MGVTVTPLPGQLMTTDRIFHAWDYVVFGGTLLVTAIIGLYIGIKYRKKWTVREMLLGGKDLGTLPVSLSLVATMTSTVFVLGVPSEAYSGGDWPIYLALSFIPATIITVHVFIPIFHKLGVTSAYEYLGIRFNKVIQFFAALIFIVMQIFTQALTLYTPAVGFSLVAGVSLEISILLAGFVCTFYTALGGLRAVILSDIFQVGAMLAGILGLLIKGTIDAGGIDKIFLTPQGSKRLQLWSNDWSLNTTYSFWSQFFGGSVVFLGLFASNQQTVQRYCSIKLCRDAQKAAYIAMVFYIISWLLMLLIGLVIYNFYYTCDPLIMEVIYNPDQVLPLFIMNTIGHLHGLPGFFSAAVFGAVLSSVSSGINSLAAVTLEDVIRPLHMRLKKKEIEEETEKGLTRALAMIYGVLSVAFSYLPIRFGTYLSNLEITFSAFGVLGGPIMGAFVLGAMVPVANAIGCGVGMGTGLLFGLWIWIGRMLCVNTTIKPEHVAIDPFDCGPYYNMSGFDPKEKSPKVGWPAARVFTDCPMQEMYDISYLWYGLICALITVLVGVLVSFCSGGHGNQIINPELLCWQRLKKRHKEGRGIFGKTWPIPMKQPKFAKPPLPFVSSDPPMQPEPLVLKTGPTLPVPNPIEMSDLTLAEEMRPIDPSLQKAFVGPSIIMQQPTQFGPEPRLTDPDGVLYPGEFHLPSVPAPGASRYEDAEGILLQPGLHPTFNQMPYTEPVGVLHPSDPSQMFMQQPSNHLETIQQPMPPPSPTLGQHTLTGYDPLVLYPGQINTGFIPDNLNTVTQMNPYADPVLTGSPIALASGLTHRHHPDTNEVVWS